MTQTVEYTYTPACDMPECMAVGIPIILWLKDDVLTTDDLHYIIGSLEEIEAPEDGEYATLTIEYDDATLPDGFEFSFQTDEEDGTVCAPECGSECAWLPKVLAFAGQSIDPLSNVGRIVLQYRIFPADDSVVSSFHFLARNPVVGGLRLIDAGITCDTYDATTDFSVTMNTNGGPQHFNIDIASVTEGEVVTVFDEEDVAYDAELVVTVTVTASPPSLPGAMGLVLTLTGIVKPA